MKEPKTKLGEFWRDKLKPHIGDVVGVGLDLISGDFNDAFDKVKSAITENVQDKAESEKLMGELEARRAEMEHDWRIRSMEEETKRIQMEHDARTAALMNEVEAFKQEVADKGNARQTEIERLKVTGKRDWVMAAVAVIIILSFAFYVYCSVYVVIHPENREFFIEMRATTRDALMVLIGYYYGTSRSSRMKDETINKSIQSK